MIVEFDFVVCEHGNVLLVAVMLEGPPIQVGMFDDVEDAEAAADEFLAEHRKHLH